MGKPLAMLALWAVLGLTEHATLAADADEALAGARAAVRLKDYEKARQVLTTAAQANNPEAQYLLGSMYRNGVGIEQDLAQARRWLESAARQNHAAAEYSLAVLLTTEDPRDLTAGREWLQRAAAAGHAMARSTLQRGALPWQFEPERDLSERASRADALLAAIGRDDVATVRAFRDEELSSVMDDFGRGAFAYAAGACAIATSTVLAAREVPADRADAFGVTPLMLAAECPSSAVLERLLARKVAVNAQDAVGNTALAYAARAGSVAAVEQLLRAGADVHVTNAQGWSALDWSVRAPAAEITRELRARGASSRLRSGVNAEVQAGPLVRPPAAFPDLYRGWPDVLILAARQAPERLQSLLQSGVDPRVTSAEGYTPLVVAAITNHANNVAALLAAGATLQGVRAPDDPLRASLRYGSAELAETLLASANAVPPVEARAEPPLILAVRAQRPRAVSLLLDQRAEVDQRGRDGVTALMLAARAAQKELVLQLLRAGARADLADAAGRTALWYAAAAGALECIAPLAAATSTASSAAQSPLSAAAASGRADIVAALLKSGATPVGKTSTPLTIAAARGHVEVIAALLQAGAAVDAPDRHGDTALIAAARAGQISAVRALLAAGANRSLRNQDRANAQDVAVALGWTDLARTLER